jgi:hypothetical protein
MASSIGYWQLVCPLLRRQPQRGQIRVVNMGTILIEI